MSGPPYWFDSTAASTVKGFICHTGAPAFDHGGLSLTVPLIASNARGGTELVGNDAGLVDPIGADLDLLVHGCARS